MNERTEYEEEPFYGKQIIGILKQDEAGVKTAELCREHGISAATFYTWKPKYGGMDVAEAQRLKGLEEENCRLKRLVANLSLEKLVLKDIAEGSLLSHEQRRSAVDHAQQQGMSERWASCIDQISEISALHSRSDC